MKPDKLFSHKRIVNRYNIKRMLPRQLHRTDCRGKSNIVRRPAGQSTFQHRECQGRRRGWGKKHRAAPAQQSRTKSIPIR